MKKYLKSITITSVLIWILSLASFFIAVFGNIDASGSYRQWQNTIFTFSLPIGIISFLLMIVCGFFLLSSKARKLVLILAGGGIVVITIIVILSISWIKKINNNSDQSNFGDNGSGCLRLEPYPLAPEFERALSLIEQRESEYTRDKSNAVNWIRNCLDIQYADTGDAEGQFYFDDSISTTEKLVIKVNPSYKKTDDLLTALLLRHELNHAGSYVLLKDHGTATPCVQEEVLAFHWQYQFYLSLTEEEKKSIATRLMYDKATNKEANAQIQILDDLSVYHNQAVKACDSKEFQEGWECYTSNFTSRIKKYVELNPFYQKQCGL